MYNLLFKKIRRKRVNPNHSVLLTVVFSLTRLALSIKTLALWMSLPLAAAKGVDLVPPPDTGALTSLYDWALKQLFKFTVSWFSCSAILLRICSMLMLLLAAVCAGAAAEPDTLPFEKRTEVLSSGSAERVRRASLISCGFTWLALLTLIGVVSRAISLAVSWLPLLRSRWLRNRDG